MKLFYFKVLFFLIIFVLFSCDESRTIDDKSIQETPIVPYEKKIIEEKEHLFSLFDEKFYVIALEDKINVRSKPDTTSEVLGQVNSSDIFEFIEKTEQSETINGKKSKWYKIKLNSKTNGYVFGSYFLIFQNMKYSETPVYYLKSDDSLNSEHDFKVTVGLELETNIKNGEFDLRIDMSHGAPMRANYKPDLPPKQFIGVMDGPGISTESKLFYDDKIGRYVYFETTTRYDEDGKTYEFGSEYSGNYLGD